MSLTEQAHSLLHGAACCCLRGGNLQLQLAVCTLQLQLTCLSSSTRNVGFTDLWAPAATTPGLEDSCRGLLHARYAVKALQCTSIQLLLLAAAVAVPSMYHQTRHMSACLWHRTFKQPATSSCLYTQASCQSNCFQVPWPQPPAPNPADRVHPPPCAKR